MEYLTPRYTQLVGSGRVVHTTSNDDDDDTNVRRLIIGSTLLFTIFVYALESYLSYRQRRTYKLTSFPKELELAVGNIDAEEETRRKLETTGGGGKAVGGDEGEKEKEGTKEDETSTSTNKLDRSAPLLPQLRSKFLNAQSYGLDKVNFSLLSSSYSTIEGASFMLLGFMPYAWDTSCNIGKWDMLRYDERTDEIKISLIFLLLTTILGTITGLPFELYSTFRIEKRHGFNKTTLGLFVSDKIKGLLLTACLGGPFVALLLKIIKWGGERFYLYVWGFTFVFSLFMMTLYPVVIMPMFNTYEALPSGVLKDRIYALAGRLNFPLTKLFVMDGSKRSSHSNAFMFGFFKNKRIVLFDTLLKQVHDDEILAILGHELGKAFILFIH
jgi:STE24 endopeptidase